MKKSIKWWILYILSWIIFVGVGIEAGGFITNTVATLILNPVGAKHFWQQADLSSLYYYDRVYFIIETSFMCIVAVLKAWIFYVIIQIQHSKKVSISQPFNKAAERFIFIIACLSLFTGLLCLWGAKYAAWFVTQGVKMPDIQYLGIGGGDVWVFMGVALFVIGQVFKKGIEIQSENELTV